MTVTDTSKSGRIVGAIALLLLPALFLSSCASEKKKAPKVYAYQLPWSGNTLVRSTIVPLPPGKDYDASARLVAYLAARSRVQSLYIAAVRALPLVGKTTVGQILDRKPAVKKRVETFLTHARIRTVAYRPGQGLYLEEVAYLGSDFQSLLGVTLHLVPHKKKVKRGANTAKAGQGGSGGGMPMMPMMP